MATFTATASLTGTPVGSAILTGLTPITYTLVIYPRPIVHPEGTCVEVPIDKTLQFYAHKVGSDGSDVIIRANWTTDAGTIDSNGLFTPAAKIGSGFTVTATEA